MKARLIAVTAIWVIGTAAAVFTVHANAGCGDLPAAPASVIRQTQRPRMDEARLIPAAYFQVADRAVVDAPIVGVWNFSFVAQGNPPPGPPDGTPIDKGYAIWHSDGTEITNSGTRPPPSGNFCMGG